MTEISDISSKVRRRRWNWLGHERKITVWDLKSVSRGAAYKTKFTRIQTKQNQWVRGIVSAHRRENNQIYYTLRELLDLTNIYRMKLALFAQKLNWYWKEYSCWFFFCSYTTDIKTPSPQHQVYIKSILLIGQKHQLRGEIMTDNNSHLYLSNVFSVMYSFVMYFCSLHLP